jgi:predicted transcriptional regulator
MHAVKTAISLDNHLHEAGVALAKEMHISRSRLIALALEEFIERRRSRQLLEQLDAAYAEGPDPAELALQNAKRSGHFQALKGEW